MIEREFPVSVQSLYAELVERAWQGDLRDLLTGGGSLYTRSRNGRMYWYWQPPTTDKERPSAKYLGPDSERMRERIDAIRDTIDAKRERREMVRTLQAARLPSPDARTAEVLAAFSEAGIFRLRAVVVGTTAFQCYPGLLGVRMPPVLSRTGDLDIAQFHSVSLAVDDSVDTDIATVLKQVDRRFRSISDPLDDRKVMRYALYQGEQEVYSVDMLCPLRGPERGRTTTLKAIGAGAQLLRFLDFLIYQEMNAVVLQGAGIPINVPRPERYALHKLIVAQARSKQPRSQEKARKDIQQAESLISVLSRHRPGDLTDAWHELYSRGPAWRRQALRSLASIPRARDALEDAERRIAAADKDRTSLAEPLTIEWPEGTDGRRMP